MSASALLERLLRILQRSANIPSSEVRTVADIFDELKPYATEVALLADVPPDGVSAYAEDTGAFYMRAKGRWSADANETVEALILRVNPGSGSDPSPPMRITRQSVADSVTFATIAAAVESLPPLIKHNVEIRIADGDWTLPTTKEPFGDWSRFAVMADVRVTLRSESISERVAGTTSYPVASSTPRTASAEGFVTLQADPGFAANDKRGKYLYVASGTGAIGPGSFQHHKAISKNAAAVITVAGSGMNPPLDATSVVEFRQPAARLTIPAAIAASPGIRVKGRVPRGTPGGGLEAPFNQSFALLGLEIISASVHQVQFFLADTHLEAVTFNGARPTLFSGFWAIAGLVVRGLGSGSLVVQQGGFYRGSGTPSVLLYDGAIGWQMQGQLSEGIPSNRIFGVSFYNLTSHAFDVQAGARLFIQGPVSTTSALYVDNVAGHFVNTLRGAFVDLPSGFTSLPVGAAGAVNLDAVSTSYATIDAATADTVVGQKHSVVSSQ